jgi:hypothetical protein
LGFATEVSHAVNNIAKTNGCGEDAAYAMYEWALDGAASGSRALIRPPVSMREQVESPQAA